MDTKGLINFLENSVMDWDGWEDEEMEMFREIVKRLKEYDELKRVIKVYQKHDKTMKEIEAK